MSSPIIPVSRSLYLCDFHAGYQDGRIDLYGIFNAIRPVLYPHSRPRLTVFTQLTGGLGEVPFFFDIRHEEEREGIYTTPIRVLRFPNRTTILQLAVTLEGVRFPGPGVFVVDLFCHNTWVCDATLVLH